MVSPRVLNPVVKRPVTREARVTRSPSQPFYLQGRPWSLNCACLFPVLPGETMTSAFIQGQFWTDPLKSQLKNSPWFFEYWLFYVKFRDLPGWEASADGMGRDLIQMIEVGESQAANAVGAYAPIHNTPKGGQPFALEGLKRITECYFREEGQAWNVALDADNMPVAHAFAGARRDVYERLAIGGVGTAPVAEDRRVLDSTYVGGTAYQALMDYAAMRNQSSAELQAMDYEDIVRSAGGRAVVRDVDRDDLHVPELLGVVRFFDYPVNTVEPTTGSPSVAFGTRIKQSLNQNFRFPEFGWVMGVCCWRPKALYKNAMGAMACMMDTRSDWFMASDDPDADAHWKQVAANAGPLAGLLGGPNTPYAVDMRNLLWHGEQWHNYDINTVPGDCIVTLPSTAGSRDYPSQADQDAIFATTGGRVRMNGVIDISVKTYAATNPNLTQDDRQFSNRD